jgi:hypothetical protein
MKTWAGILAAVALLALPVPAQSATTFEGTFVVTSDAEFDPALVIQTDPTLNTQSAPFSFSLNVGESFTDWDLFRIWTEESAVNPDDLVEKNLSVAFSFTEPPPPFGGTVGGTTEAECLCFSIFGKFIVLAGQGELEFDDSILVAFGPIGDGILEINLYDTTFNAGIGGLFGGPEHGSDVKAKFTLVQDATHPIPLPAALPLFATGLVVGAYLHYRRRTRAAGGPHGRG